MKDEAACADRIESLTDAIKSMDIVCGYCYTQLTDVQQEVNELLRILLQKFRLTN